MRMLEIHEIASALGLKRSGSVYIGPCPSCDYQTGFSLKEGEDCLLFYCHAGGCTYTEIKQALITEGLLPSRNDDFQSGRHANRAKNSPSRPNVQGSAMAAHRLWKNSHPAEGTPVEVYLRSRGYTGSIPPSIRFLPDAWHNETQARYPVMLAGVVRFPLPDVVAVHRTFLLSDGQGKANIEPNKKSLGPIAGGAVRMAEVGEKLLITEGIENALTAYLASGLPAWAALSTGGLQQLILPSLPWVAEVIICADNDTPGLKAACVAAERFIAQGRKVKIAKPVYLNADLNDVLRKGEE